MSKRNAWYLRKMPPFASLSDELVEGLARAMDLRELSARKPLYLPGDVADHVFLLHGGRVNEFFLGQADRMLMIGLYRPTEVFGESCLWTPGPRDAMAVTATAVLLSVVPRTLMRLIMDDHPPLERALAVQAIARRDAVARRFSAVVSSSVRVRLAQQLLELWHSGQDTATAPEVPLSIRHHELAALVGATRETVSIELRNLEREQAISREGRKIFPGDLDRLRFIAGVSRSTP